ncbi:MAG TPA: histidinol-phosphatase [Candidatus Brevibacterium intestinigallinarum]|nr:histidinol-phosphatase [Candidatus Brevibacterium intestinigallinarum]
MTVADDLSLALSLADAADSLALPRFDAHDFAVESKPDLTPVTEVDRAVEQLVSQRLADERPDDALLGEEFGSRGSEGGRRWIIDPIDGTKNFVRGVPVWATLIGLYDGEEPLVGVVSAPALGLRWWASAGGGAFRSVRGGQAQRLGVSRVGDLADASVSYSSLSGWQERGLRDGLLGLFDDVWRTRAYGDFWSYMMVAEGVVEIAAEPELELYDMAALVPIVTEAGGTFTGLDGRSGPFGGDAIASNGLLHEAARTRLNGAGA